MARLDRAIQQASVREPMKLYDHLDGPQSRAMTAKVGAGSVRNLPHPRVKLF